MDEVIDRPHQKAIAEHNLLDAEGGATQITPLNSQDDLGNGMFRAPESRQAVVHNDALRTEETPNRSATHELYSNMVHQMDFEDFIPFCRGAANSNDEALTTFGSSYAPCTLTFNDQAGPGVSYDNGSGHYPPTFSEIYNALLNELYSEAPSGNPVHTEFISGATLASVYNDLDSSKAALPVKLIFAVYKPETGDDYLSQRLSVANPVPSWAGIMMSRS
ncbi:uncharacterized protein Z518_10225 [Rhinocladiella mackenziei CBS 650.93]|uniref:Uncharacterized protein n=1 Tax=Rhinocladiella mackenziei CBS 650.93 TaxID=1442369 RepID=A0A0D2GP31_9EURO|nr:uncharacterized protein Z518_10225 [Rhinocladiella mackenziei CBS 650.93]KIX00088.1 hypothetical protein Z518_10225 [Rhinocladiella mackenziei CBS 650.93]